MASYRVNVTVSDGEDSTGDAETNPTADDTLTLTITVTNADVPGTARITGGPKVNGALTASVSDPDGSVTGESWRWSRSRARAGAFTEITGANSATYTPAGNDFNHYLRATVTYTDPQGSAKSAHAATSSPVLTGLVSNTAQAAATPVATSATRTKLAQAFTTGSASDTRRLSTVDLGLSAGSGTTAAVFIYGHDVANSRPGSLLFTLSAPDSIDADAASVETFSLPAVLLDAGTTYWVVVENVSGSGQVTVATTSSDAEDAVRVSGWSIGGVLHEFNDTADAWAASDIAANLKVALRGARGGSKPLVTNRGVGGRLTSLCENEHEVVQAFTTGANATGYSLSSVGLLVGNTPALEATVTVGIWSSDSDGQRDALLATLRNPAELSTGTHAWHTNEIRLAPSTQYFVKVDVSWPSDDPNPPAPALDNGVCVIHVANDAEKALNPPTGWTIGDGGQYRSGGANTEWTEFRYPLRVTIEGASMDVPGGVTFTAVPRVGTESRATLSDDDGLLSYPSWQWWRAESAEGPFTKIGGATAAEYTPTAADSRKVLRATVAYSDPQGPNKMAAGTTLRVDALRFVSNHRHAIAGSQQAMFLQSFDTGTSLGSFVPGDVAVHLVKADGEATVRDPVVKLLSDETDNGIVDPAKVIATLSRGDDPGDTGTYWFSPRSDVVLQPETTYFVEVSSTHASGRVNASTVAGTESDGPVLPGWHFGELRTRDSVSDPWGAPATGALRLEVRGFAQLAGGSAPQFFGGNTTALSLAEDATATTRFGSVSAIDYDGDTNLTYTVVATGADAAALADLAAFNRDFELDPASAQVSVRAGAQLDDETRSTYVVKVNVTDGEDANGDIEATPVVDDTSTLTITVTNVDDRGRVSVAGVPQQGITLTASLDDPDGAVTGETWQWSRSGSRDGRFVDIADATAATYAPTAEDEGQYLRVTVRYADGAGDGKSALATTQSWVPAEFVANVDQTSATAVATSASRTAFAQAFTTGSDAAYFTLSSIGLGLSENAAATAAVRLHSHDASNNQPGTLLQTLSLRGNTETDTDTATLETFTAPQTRLDRRTTYWVVVEQTAGTGGISVATTATDGEDSGSEPGWIIGDELLEFDSAESTWGPGATAAEMKMAVRGRPTLGSRLISNIDRSPSGNQCWSLKDQAQQFATGTNETGYTLRGLVHSIRNGSASSASIAAEIWTSTSADRPGVLLGTLTNPADFEEGNRVWSTTGINLAPSTKYFVVIDVDAAQGGTSGVCSQLVQLAADHADPHSGWTFTSGSLNRNRTSSSDWTKDRRSMRLAFEGYALSGNETGRASDNARLRRLTLNDGFVELRQSDQQGTSAYTADVAYEVVTVKLNAAAEHRYATVTIVPDDADPDTEGHQVSIAEGANTVTVTVTAQDGDTETVHELTVNRPVVTPFATDAAKDIASLGTAGSSTPQGAWSNGNTLWVVNASSDNLDAYSVSTGRRQVQLDILMDSTDREPYGVWSDGVAIWVADDGENKLIAFDLASNARRADLDIALLNVENEANTDPRGVWSDGTTIWVADNVDDKVYAYDLSSGSRVSSKDVTSLGLGRRRDVTGIWSDGETMWAADASSNEIYAYRLSDGSRQVSLKFDTLHSAQNHHPAGLWSDGRTMWVVDGDDRRIYAYNMPKRPLLQHVDIDTTRVRDFGSSPFSLTHEVPVGTTSVTIDAVALLPDATVTVAPADADPQTDGNQIALEAGTSPTNATITVSLSARISNTKSTETYTLRVQRAAEVSFGQPDDSVAEGDTLAVTVNLSDAFDANVTVPITVAEHGGATAADYSGVPTEVTFAAGQTEATFEVAAAVDTDGDNGESLVFAFGELPGGLRATTQATATVRIIGPPAAVSSLSLTGSSSAIAVRWNSLGADFSGEYVVQWKPANDDWARAQEARVTAPTTWYAITGAIKGIDYSVRVAGETDGIQGEWSESSGALRILAPHNLSLEGGFLQFHATWAPPTETAGSAAKYAVQWRRANESYSNARRRIYTEASQRISIPVLAAGGDYTVRVVSLDAEDQELDSVEATVGTESATEYIEREIIAEYEDTSPWLRQAWDVRLPVNVVESFGGYSGGYTFHQASTRTPDGFNWTTLVQGSALTLARRFATSHGTITHELAHHLTSDHRIPENPAAAVSAGWLYFLDRVSPQPTGFCVAREIYADVLSYQAVGAHANASYLRGCGLTSVPPSAADMAVGESVGRGDIPQWLYDEHAVDGTAPGTATSQTLDLNRLWSGIKATPGGLPSRIAYGFRGQFGGFCSYREAHDVLAASSSAGHPWMENGCKNRRPQALAAADGNAAGEIVLSWSAPLWSTTPAIDRYVVQWKASGETYDTTRQAVVSDLTDLSHTITGLTSGTEYTVRVTAANSADQAAVTDDDGRSRVAELVFTAP